VQKRKAWLAEALELRSPAELPQMLGVHWWFHFGMALCEVIMPPEFYMVGPRERMVWDDIGLKALARDWAAWPGTPSDDLMHRSQFNLFRDLGAHLLRAVFRCLAVRNGSNRPGGAEIIAAG
jgi:hypothetical protein